MTQRVPVISPELVLVDPALAKVARAELRDPREFVAARLPAAPESSVRLALRNPTPDLTAAPPAGDSRPRRRRRSRALGRVLLAAVFLVGGFAVGRMTATPPPGFTIEQELLDGAPAASTPRRGSATETAARSDRRTTRRRSPRPHAKSRTASRVVAGTRRGRGLKAASKRRRSPGAATPVRVQRPSRNVLGVIVSLSPGTVTIRWRAPTSSRRVIVLRRLQGTSNRRLVYRGTRRWLRDGSLRSGTYTYVIVNYDRGRRASSGVPTVVDVAGTDL
jgi:hypothetical protein